MRYSDIDKLIRQKLSGIYPDRESGSMGRLVLESVTGSSWVQIRLNYEKAFTPDEETQITEIIARLEKHEPVQYVLGETEFYGLKLKVRPGVLIPRGETEELVDWIIKSVETHNYASLQAVKAQGARHKAQGKEEKDEKEEGRKGLRVLDVGCGSGAITIALAKYLPGAEVVASDISEQALQLTRENAVLNGIGVETHNYASIRTLHLDVLSTQSTCHPREGGDPVPDHNICLEINSSVITEKALFFPCALRLEPFDLIVSNPPYIPLGEMTAMDLHVIEYEPKTALFVPDNDPLLFYRAIAKFAVSHLNPEGQVFVEIHDRLGEETANVFRKWFSTVELRKDIHGKDRMIRAHHG